MDRAEKRYAAYTKKNVITMYRSINDVASKKQRGVVSHESAHLYQSLPQLGDKNESREDTTGQFTSLLGKDESKTLFVAPNSGSVELPEATFESDEGN